ncbi:MAG: alpha/beta hydrolase [Rhodospirillaceae bacterium]
MANQPLYHGLDRAGLDFNYNNRERVPNHAEIYAAWAPACEAVLADFETRLDIAYGDHPRERLDIFLPDAAKHGDGPHPIRIFVHGGYWMSRDKEDSHFIVRGLVEAGAIVISVEYALIPSVDMAELVRQCRAAVKWAHDNAASFGGDADRLYVSGHSAGGHVAAMLLATDWTEWGLPADAVRGGAAVSGIFDLTPMRLCYINDTINLSGTDVADFSPITLAPTAGAETIVCVGAAETDEFVRQSRAFAKAWGDAEHAVELLESPGANHFTILDAYAGGDLCHAMIRQMGLGL